MIKDYGNIRYPIHMIREDVDVVDAFPDLRQVKIFKDEEHDFVVTIDGARTVERVDLGGLSNNFVMRYIILMYSPGSPAVERFPQIGKRKTWVMSELGVYPDANNQYDSVYSQMLLNENRLILKKTSVFLTMQSPADWSILLKGEEDLEEILSMPIPEDPVKQGARIKAIEMLREQINSSRERIMKGDNSRMLEIEIDEFRAHTSLGIRPEEFVMMQLPPKKPSEVKHRTVYDTEK